MERRIGAMRIGDHNPMRKPGDKPPKAELRRQAAEALARSTVQIKKLPPGEALGARTRDQET